MAYTRRQKTTKRKGGQRPLVLTVAAVVAALVLIGAWWMFMRNDSGVSKTSNTDGTTGSGINLNPPTEQERTDTEQHKDDLSNGKDEPVQPVGEKVTPVITYTGQYGSNIEVSAYVPTIVEDGGTCTLTATKGSSTVTKQVDALKNAQNTVCSSFSISRGEMGAGTWNIVVAYQSAAHGGTSASKSLEVQ